MIWLRFWLDIWKTRPSKLWGSALWIWSCNTNLYIIAPVHWTVFNWIITKSIYSCYNNTCVGITRVLEQSRLTNEKLYAAPLSAVPLWRCFCGGAFVMRTVTVLLGWSGPSRVIQIVNQIWGLPAEMLRPLNNSGVLSETLFIILH